jgi:uncharacterized protein (DUF1778 family)
LEQAVKTARQPAAPTSFRLSTEIRQLLQRAAEQERRSQTSMLEVMVEAWCKDHRIAAPKRGAK